MFVRWPVVEVRLMMCNGGAVFLRSESATMMARTEYVCYYCTYNCKSAHAHRAQVQRQKVAAMHIDTADDVESVSMSTTTTAAASQKSCTTGG